MADRASTLCRGEDSAFAWAQAARAARDATPPIGSPPAAPQGDDPRLARELDATPQE